MVAPSAFSSVFNLVGMAADAWTTYVRIDRARSNPNALTAGYITSRLVNHKVLYPAAFAIAFVRLITEIGITHINANEVISVFAEQHNRRFLVKETSNLFSETGKFYVLLLFSLAHRLKYYLSWTQLLAFMTARSDGQIEQIFIDLDWLLKHKKEVDLTLIDPFRPYFAMQNIPSTEELKVHLAALQRLGCFLFPNSEEEETYPNPPLS